MSEARRIKRRLFRKGETKLLGEEFLDNRGEAHDTKFRAQLSSLLNFVQGCFYNGIPIYAPWLWFNGLAAYPFFFIGKGVTVQTINHERIHCRQQLELLVVFAYLWYVIEFLVRLAQYRNLTLAYHAISFEREAFENQANLNYLFEKKKWSFLKYL